MKLHDVGIFALFVGVVSAASCVTSSRKYDETVTNPRSPAGTYYEDAVASSYDLSPEATISCKEFFKLLTSQNTKPSTLVEVLQIIKQAKPKFFSHYSLLPRSHSLQESSWSNPRAMVYGGDGKTVLAFNGDPSQAGYGTLELMCFNDADASFEFREIIFPKEASLDDMLELNAAQRRLPYYVSDLDGTAIHDCRTCHMDQPRPNWDTYAIWPSTYGANDDMLFRKAYFKDAFANDTESFTYKYNSAELEKFNTFARKGRYSVLQDNFTTRPNLAAGQVFLRLNTQRIVAQLKRLGAKFDSVKKDFARALYCPVQGIESKTLTYNDPSGGIESTSRLVLGAPVDPLVRKMAEQNASYFVARQSDIDTIFKIGSYPTEDIDAVIQRYFESLGFGPANARKMIFDQEMIIRLANISRIVAPFHIDIRNWSLVPVQDSSGDTIGGYEFEDGLGSDAGPAFAQAIDKPFLDTFFADDQILKNLVKTRREDLANAQKSAEIARQEEAAICAHLQ